MSYVSASVPISKKNSHVVRKMEEEKYGSLLQNVGASVTPASLRNVQQVMIVSLQWYSLQFSNNLRYSTCVGKLINN